MKILPSNWQLNLLSTEDSNFKRKNLKSDNCLFKKVNKNVNTRQSTKLVSDYKCRTSKYRKSSIPYLARLLNSNNKK